MALNRKIGIEIDTAMDDARGLADYVSAGIGAYRHAAIDWRRREPVKVSSTSSAVYKLDPDTWANEPYANEAAFAHALDAGIALASAEGMQVSIIIREPPTWAMSTVGGGCPCVSSAEFYSFAKFVDQVIMRYKAAPYNVMYYELFNEPDFSGYYGLVGGFPDVGAYIEMCKRVYEYVKPKHPTVQIVSGGVVFNETWTRSFIVRGGLNYVDIFAYHAYENIPLNKKMWDGFNNVAPNYPSVYQDSLAKIRTWISLATTPYSTEKQAINIWMNEGAAIGDGRTGLYPDLPDLKRIQAYFIAYMLAQTVGENLEQYGWFGNIPEDSTGSYFQTALGTVHANPYWFEPNTLYDAFKFGLAFVDGCTYSATVRGNVSIIKFIAPGGPTGGPPWERWLMWNTNGANADPVVYTFDAENLPHAAYDVWGGTNVISSEDHTITMGCGSFNKDLLVVWVQWEDDGFTPP